VKASRGSNGAGPARSALPATCLLCLPPAFNHESLEKKSPSCKLVLLPDAPYKNYKNFKNLIKRDSNAGIIYLPALKLMNFSYPISYSASQEFFSPFPLGEEA
jgi:hypothetical protein